MSITTMRSSPRGHRVRGCDSDVVVQTKAHCAVTFRVVSWWTHHRERRLVVLDGVLRRLTAAPAARVAISTVSGEVKVSGSSIAARPAQRSIASR